MSLIEFSLGLQWLLQNMSEAHVFQPQFIVFLGFRNLIFNNIRNHLI